MTKEQESLMKELEVCLSTVFAANGIDSNQLSMCVDKVTAIVDKYDVSSKCTDIVVVKNSNPKLVKLYVACLRINGKSEKTIYQYYRTCKQFSDFIGKSFLDISPYDVRLYLAMLGKRGCKNRTLENQRANISAFYKWLTREGHVSKNPVESVLPVKYVEKKKRPFSEVELDAIRCACKTPKQRALIEMLLHTGVRASELCNMDVTDIDLENRIAYVINGKGGKNRKVYFNQLAAKYYSEYLQTRKDGEMAAFASKYGRLTPSGVRNILKTIGNNSGVQNVHPHRFRRTLASMLADKGMPLNEIMIILGHANLDTTRIYIFTADKRVSSSYNRICGD